MINIRIKKPRGDVVIPRKVIKRIRREMGEEAVKFFQLLCELADENGQIRFPGDEEEMMEQLQDLYTVRFGDSEDA